MDDCKCPECGKNSIKIRKIKRSYKINGKTIKVITNVRYCNNCNSNFDISNLNQHSLFTSGALQSTIIDLM